VGLIINIDGGARGNPGPAGAGVVIRTDDGRLIHEGGYFLGRQTNNQAEYTGLIRALERAARCGDQPLTIYSDSELLVRQITGEYRVKNPGLQELYYEVQKLLIRVSVWKIRHVRREQNSRADELANLAMDQHADQIVFDEDDSASSARSDAVRPAQPATPPDAAPAAPAPGATPGRRAKSPGPSHARDAQKNDARKKPRTPAGPADPGSPPFAGRVVRVTLATAPADGACPAGGPPIEFAVGQTLPADLCIHAAHAMLQTLLAMQGVEAKDFANLPTLTVRCGRAGCGAVFHISPHQAGNGKVPH